MEDKSKITKEHEYLRTASMLKGILTGTIKGVLTWDNISPQQRKKLEDILEEYEAIQIVK